MQLLVIRHAIAEDREEFAQSGRDDGERPLTKVGEKKMRSAARGLRELLPTIATLVSSPLVRARETAEIVRNEYGLGSIAIAPELDPETPLAKLTAALARYEGEIVAVVGHEPQLSRLITYLTSGVDRSAVELKKGAACLLEFDGTVRRGGGTLLWAVAPRTLRTLAD